MARRYRANFLEFASRNGLTEAGLFEADVRLRPIGLAPVGWIISLRRNGCFWPKAAVQIWACQRHLVAVVKLKIS